MNLFIIYEQFRELLRFTNFKGMSSQSSNALYHSWQPMCSPLGPLWNARFLPPVIRHVEWKIEKGQKYFLGGSLVMESKCAKFNHYRDNEL